MEESPGIIEGILAAESINNQHRQPNPNGKYPVCIPDVRQLPGYASICGRCGGIPAYDRPCPAVPPEQRWGEDYAVMKEPLKRKRKTPKQRREQRRQNVREALAKGQFQMMMRHIAGHPELLEQPSFLDFLRREGRTDLIRERGFVMSFDWGSTGEPPIIYDASILEEYKASLLGKPGKTIPVNLPYLLHTQQTFGPFRLEQFDDVSLDNFRRRLDSLMESMGHKIDAEFYPGRNPRES